jgi:hypothetical protein
VPAARLLLLKWSTRGKEGRLKNTLVIVEEGATRFDAAAAVAAALLLGLVAISSDAKADIVTFADLHNASSSTSRRRRRKWSIIAVPAFLIDGG